MALYRPPTRVVSIETPYLALVTSSDPQFERRKHREVEYAWSNGKMHLADPYVRGIYNSFSNIYPVGQQYGGLDQEVVDNRPLYAGVPTGSWA